MKNILFLGLLATVVLNSCHADSKMFRPNAGSGQVIQKTYDYSFDGVEVSTSLKAEIIKSDTEKIVVSAPSDLLESVKVDRGGGLVHIYIETAGGLFKTISTKDIHITVFAKDFSMLKATSSASIILKDTFTQDKMNVEVSSSGDISGNLEANSLAIAASSSGDFSGKITARNLMAEATSSATLTMEGRAQAAKIKATSSGTVSAKNLTVESADLDASSSGSIAVAVSSTLNANASSSGEVTVHKVGTVNATVNKSSSGTVDFN